MPRSARTILPYEGDVVIIVAGKTYMRRIMSDFSDQSLYKDHLMTGERYPIKKTPVMTIRLYNYYLSILELISLRGFYSLMT